MTTRIQDPSVQGPRRSARRGLRAFCATLVASGLTALVATSAQAEYANVTAQAVRANADWLAWAPIPANGPVAACLVDTGVDSNGDTSSSVITASPLDVHSSPGDGGTTKHGTLMASIMAAPHNGWGMVGAWPQLKIVDVRAVTPGANTFTYNNYQRAIGRCRSVNTSTPVAVINLSLGGDPSLVPQEDRDLLADAVIDAKTNGFNVVAAAGNAGAGVLSPGDYAGIFTVAAGDNGALCSFASRGPEVDVAAPGCGLDQAFPDGTPAVSGWGSSQASAFTSAVIAALRAYKPSLTVTQVEAALVDTAASIAGGYKQLDVQAAFEAQGLGVIVSQAKAAKAAALADSAPPASGGGSSGGGGVSIKETVEAPAPTPAPTKPVAAPQQPSAADDAAVVIEDQLPTPKARKPRSSDVGTLLTLTNRPKDALAIITVYSKRAAQSAAARKRWRVVERLRGMTSRFVIDVDHWDRIEVVYRDGLSGDSTPLTIAAPSRPASKSEARRQTKKASR